MSDNIPDIIAQAEVLGFIGVTASKLVPNRWLSFRVDGHKQRDAGRIKLTEITLKNGRRVYTGGIWIWDGVDSHYEKIDLSSDKSKYGSTSEERKSVAQELKKQRAKAEAFAQAKANKATLQAERNYFNYKPAIPSSALYLSDKYVDAYDIKQTGDGAAVVPIRGGGQILALQFLLSKSIPSHAEKIRRIGTNKRIWPAGCKIKGGYHWIGGIPRPGDVVVIAEGYATAATIHKATGLICVVAFSAGNIKPVVDVVLAKYPDSRLLIAADDDDLKQCSVETCRHRFMLSQLGDGENCPECGTPHKRNNAGVLAAMKACTDARVSHIVPPWADVGRRLHDWVKHGNKRTDFNDLMIDEGGAAVRLLFERYIADLRIKLPSHAPPVAALPTHDDGKTKYIVEDLPTALWRFVLIADGGDSVYDMLLRKIVKMSDARNQFHTRDLYRRWQEATEPDKRVIKMDDIGLYFDEKDRDRPGNMWRGLATQPVQNEDLSKELTSFVLEVICGGNEVYFKFLMCCLAYSVQRLGDRPKIGIILNSDEGFGKGTFARLALRVWGEYGIVFDQEALEDRFNAQKENKCITIFEEIGAASGMDRHKLKNLMKHAVDGDTQRINPKQVNARNVKNYAVSFFLTNELLAFLLGNQGRRWFVLRLKTKKDKDYYKKINEIIESEAGGNAWHYCLENYPLGDFHAYTDPPDTPEKQEMVLLSRDPPLMFWDELMNGDILEDKAGKLILKSPILNSDLYALAEIWAKKSGIKWIPSIQYFIPHIKNQDGVTGLRASYSLVNTTTLYDNGVPYDDEVEEKFTAKSFILPKNCVDLEKAGSGLAEQLGKCVLAFRAAMGQYASKK